MMNKINLDNVLKNVPLVCLSYVSCTGVGAGQQSNTVTRHLEKTIHVENQGINFIFNKYEDIIDECLLKCDIKDPVYAFSEVNEDDLNKGKELMIKEYEFSRESISNVVAKLCEAKALFKTATILSNTHALPAILMPMTYIEFLVKSGYTTIVK